MFAQTQHNMDGVAEEGVRVVKLELVSFGWSFGPERRAGQQRKKKKSSRCKEVWAAALNLRKFANPPSSMRRRGLTGLDRELQAAVWAAPNAEALYEKVRSDVVAILTEWAHGLVDPAATESGTE